jgi:erythromycin esterase-like protein
MTMNAFRPAVSLTATIWLAALAGCGGPPPPPPTPPVALSASATAALQWVNGHAGGIVLTDSMNLDRDRHALAPIASGARVFGLSELTEGTEEFPDIVRRTLFALADSGFRGVAIQGPMPEALELNRWVQTSQGDPRRIMRQLGSWRWDTRQMWAFMLAMRQWNIAHKDQPLGFYGFEIPTAARAVQVATGLPDSVAGVALNQWLKRTYTCVATNEAAQWGREGRAADSSFWNACGPATVAAADSLGALRSRYPVASPVMPQITFAESMARLIRHHVSVGLRHLPREKQNAEHVIYLLDELGPGGKLLLWGGDVEMGRIVIDNGRTIQTGVPLGERLGDKYRAVAFAIGGGTIRARVPAAPGRGGGGGGEPGYGNTRVAVPELDSYEDVLMRANNPYFWLDMRGLPSDSAGTWLHGPRQMRLISDLYTPLAPTAFETSVEFPKNYDAIVFARTVNPAHP